MIEYYLSNNNEMCYNVKIQTFSQTKHTVVIAIWQRRRILYTLYRICFCWLGVGVELLMGLCPCLDVESFECKGL